VPDEKTGKLVRAATPLFLALVVINLADLVFAVDSVPAIFAITTDTFIVYTSNIMAILGLRALYFALAAMVHRFHYLKYALALVLVFIGSKIFVVRLPAGRRQVPAGAEPGVTFGLIAAGVLYSLWKTKGAEEPDWASSGRKARCGSRKAAICCSATWSATRCIAGRTREAYPSSSILPERKTRTRHSSPSRAPTASSVGRPARSCSATTATAR
jgi:hypothetical protein